MNQTEQKLHATAQGITLGTNSLSWSPDPQLLIDGAHEISRLERELARVRASIEDVIKRPDYTNPEGMVRRLREALPNARNQPRDE